MTANVTVALNAQINPDCAGGTETSVLSLIRGLTAEPLGATFKVLALPHLVDSMRRAVDGVEVLAWPHSDNQQVSASPKGWKQRLKGLFKPAPQKTNAAAIDRDLKQLGVDVIHFGYPHRFDTDMPFVYEPQDLQHLHLPQFFTAEQIQWRNEVYGGGSRRAAFVVVGTHWTKADVVANFGVPAERVAVVPRGTLMKRDAVSIERAHYLLQDLGIPRPFALYPAMSFPHKNHIRLMEAVALLRDRDRLKINIVCSGRIHKPFWPTLKEHLERLRLQEQFLFVGPQPDETLSSLFTLANFVVFPSLFEGLSQALLEALHFGQAIIAADASSNAETVGRAGLLFDGLDVDDIAAKLKLAASSPELLSQLREAAPAECERYTWPRAARTLAALYRQASGKPLSAQDRQLLAAALTSSPHSLRAAS